MKLRSRARSRLTPVGWIGAFLLVTSPAVSAFALAIVASATVAAVAASMAGLIGLVMVLVGREVRSEWADDSENTFHTM